MHLRWILLSPFALLVLLGCTPDAPKGGGSTQPDARPPVEHRGTIGVSLLTLENPFFKVIGENIKAEAAKHGYETVVVSADRDPAKQANQIKDFIVRKCSAIVLSPAESRAVVPVIKEANEAGIPVFTVDIPCKEEGVNIVCQIATDNEGGGREAGKAMIEALDESGGKVAIIHFPQAESCRLRVKGFKEVINNHNAKARGKIEIVQELDGGGLKPEGQKAAQDAIQTHGDLRGIFAINDPSALGARVAVEQAKKTDQIVIIGFDGQPEGKQAIKEGKIYADPIQFPDKMGVEIAHAIVDHSKGKDVKPEILIPTKLYRKADAEKDPDLK
ncbi:MAG TPA: substrate-binding domain-containing protein [Gemmataceae bacterium]|nr:substrate-binding domain-containing protein [Gemmataceae bacterium]